MPYLCGLGVFLVSIVVLHTISSPRPKDCRPKFDILATLLPEKAVAALRHCSFHRFQFSSMQIADCFQMLDSKFRAVNGQSKRDERVFVSHTLPRYKDTRLTIVQN
jgi:hypothetical protein